MPSHRFPASHRLNQSSDFDAVFKTTEVRVGNAAVLLLAKHNTHGFNRLGLVIGKKHVARAVDRNRIKRQIRETFRKSMTQITGHALDIVVVARPGVRHEPQLGLLLEQSFGKLQARSAG